jgi:hypothetical protein
MDSAEGERVRSEFVFLSMCDLLLPLVSLQLLEPLGITHRRWQIPDLVESADGDFPQCLAHGLGIQSDKPKAAAPLVTIDFP